MGYTTNFGGEVAVTPALTPNQVAYLTAFCQSRRMKRDPDICKQMIKTYENDPPSELFKFVLPDPYARGKSDPDVPHLSLTEEVGLEIGDEGQHFLGLGDYGQAKDDSVLAYNDPPAGQPGLWCQWIPSEDGETIEWDGGEKFYCYVEWLQYIVDHFLKPWGCSITGEIGWWGEDSNDRGVIYVKDNKIEDIESEIVTARPSWER